MTPTKLLIGQILVVFAIVIAGVWAATQWAAAMLAYQPELGPAWFRLLGTPVYRPWAIFPWWYHFNAYAPHVFDKAGRWPAPVGLSAVVQPLPDRCGARASRAMSPLMDRRAGLNPGRSRKQGCSMTPVYSSVACMAAICAIMARSMSWSSRRLVRARASAWSFPRC